MYKFAINRPITTLMGVVTLLIFGMMSFRSMPVSLFPNVDFPMVTINTAYYGADPKTVESKVTDVIEEAVSSIDGIDKLISTSSEGMSTVIVQFYLDRPIDEAANDVRDKVSAARLPMEVEKPLVSKLDVGGAAVLGLFIASETKEPGELMMLVDERIKPRIQRIGGVGSINVVGYRDRQIKIYPDPFLLNKYGLSIQELNNIIMRENLKKSGGKLIATDRELLVKTEGDAKTIEELRNIKIRDGVRLKDIATVKDDLEDETSYSSLNGTKGVLLEIQKISGENTVDIINGVKAIMPELQKAVGDEVTLQPLNDTSDFILASLASVEFDLIYGSLLAIAIVFLFLRNLTATIVASVAIPTSIIGTFFMMDAFGYDLNKMTLIGLTLAIGIFIDDAIVVIENIYKKLEAGMGNFEASFYGIKEIAFSVLAISSMLLAVFIPVAFMGGIVGQFFNSFAVTVASGVIISYLVAVMFIPTVAARVLRKGESRFYHMTEPIFVKIDAYYVKVLGLAVRNRFKTLGLTLLILFGSFSLAGGIGMDFVPKEDKSEFEINIKGPVGISLDEMRAKTEKMVEMIRKDPMVMYVNNKIAYNTAKDIHKARIYVKIIDAKERPEMPQKKVIDKYRQMLKGFDGLFVTVADIPNIRGAGASVPYQLILQGYDLKQLEEASEKVKAMLAEKPGIVDIDSNFEGGKPEVRIEILRQNAAKAGISVKDIADTINTALSSDIAISQFEQYGRQYDITLRLADDAKQKIEDLKKLKLRAPSGEYVYLDGLVKFEEGIGPSSIFRLDRMRQITVLANLSGIPLGDAVAHTEANIEKVLPEGVNYRFSGMAEEMKKSNKAFGIALGLAFLLIYLILASLYESVLQSFIIMMALPLSFIGVLIALFVSGMSFSLFAMIGIILLMGMVGKNGVLLVDFANQEMERGKPLDEAIIAAGEKRLRPILMTTFAMVFAMIPLAISSGYGSESNAPMATAVIGGLISSMLLTLLVVPSIYKLLAPIDLWMKKYYAQKME